MFSIFGKGLPRYVIQRIISISRCTQFKRLLQSIDKLINRKTIIIIYDRICKFIYHIKIYNRETCNVQII